MKVQDDITKTKISKNEKHDHSGHMKMMVICCGVLIVGLFLISYFGISNASLETLLVLICPIGMVAMIVMMRKKEPNNAAEEESSIQGELIPQTEPSVKNISIKPCCPNK
jgi:hypothetical protein